MTKIAPFCVAVCLGLALGCTPPSDVTGDLRVTPTGSLTVTVSGVPSGGAALVTVTSAQGFRRDITGTETLTGLTPGMYSVSAGEVVVGEERYGGAPASQSIAVSPGAQAASAAVAYVAVTGRLGLAIEGVPQGIAPQLTLSGPGGYTRVLSDTATLRGLPPGTYTLTATAVQADGDSFSPDPASQLIQVSAYSGSPTVAAVRYARSTGRMALTISGLPAGVAAAIQVAGPDGYLQTVTASTTLSGLVPGTYTVTSSAVQSGGDQYQPAPSTATVTVTTSNKPEPVSVIYGISTGRLQVLVSGLPSGASAAITVTGPSGYSATVASSTLLTGLLPGSYSITAANTASGGSTYYPSPVSQTLAIVASTTAEVRSVTYSLGVGTLSVGVTGLPGGAAAAVTVTGPNGFQQLLTGSQVLANLSPGTYTVAAASVTTGGTVYAPTPTSQSLSLSIGGNLSASVAYAATTGALALTVSGLPSGVAAAVLVTGPGGYSQSVIGSQQLGGLVPGTYAVSASSVLSGGITYTAAPPTQNASVSAGATASVSVGYTGGSGGATHNLRIDGVYLTQATQSYDGLVPLVAGRDAYLRVFALASQSNTLQPQVRVRLYSGSTLQTTYTISAPSASVPTAVSEGTLASSWNVLVPASLVQPGLRVLADVDPANAIPETSESDNLFPAGGTPAAVDVRALNVFSLRFVPVLQQANTLQGNVTDANKEAFLVNAKAMLPIGPYSADVRAVYTTTAPALEPNNGNNAWNTILSEVLALKNADASTRYYYGVVKTSYGSGVVGMGYVGGSARTAIGWDVMSNAPHTMAHELGHNMSRQHAPCGGVANPDPSYPYGGGVIGAFGLDVSTLTVKNPTLPDLMGYCQPAWISDYNWKAMITYRQSGASTSSAALQANGGPGLLVWGRITGSGIVLEPAFTVAAGTGLLPVPGPNRLELLDQSGSLLRTVAFAASEVSDLPGGAEEHFAFVIPLDAATEARLAGLRVRSGVRAQIRSAADTTPDPGAAMARVNAQQVELRWNSAAYPMVMVRDAATGQVLSFARGGAARLWARNTSFALVFSNGVRSVRRAARVLQ